MKAYPDFPLVQGGLAQTDQGLNLPFGTFHFDWWFLENSVQFKNGCMQLSQS